MPNDDAPKKDEAAQGTERYKLTGTKNPGERVGRVILEGTSASPQRFLDLNGEGDLTETEVKELRASGHVLRKVSDDDNEGDDNEGKAPVVETKEQQQLAQAATAGGPGSTGTGTQRAGKPGGKS